MKTAHTFRLLFFVLTACTLLACKQQDNNDGEGEMTDTTSVMPETQMDNIDTTATPAPGTPADTTGTPDDNLNPGGTGSARPEDRR